jgi:raffinose/stachyose/melibiose transport system substrate-binding protein
MRLTTVAVALGALAACSPGAATGAGSDGAGGGPVHLKVWGWRQEDVAAYTKIFKIYEDKHPGVTVEYVPYKNTEYDTILKTGLTDSNGPDVAQLRSYGLLQPLAESGSLVPLEDVVPDLASFSKDVLDGARGDKDGKVYGVPFAIQTMNVMYNKDLFAKNGLSAPTTWEEMTAAFDTLKKAGVIPVAATVTDTWMLPIQQELFGATTYGGNDLRDKMLAGKAKFTDPAWVRSVQTWVSTKPYWEPQAKGVGYEDAKALFTSGKAATFPGGIWEVAGFEAANPKLDVGIFNVPPAPGATAAETLVPGYVDGSFGVSAKSPNKKAAEDLVRWMATKEFGQAFSDELTQISGVPGVEPKSPVLAEAVKAYAAHPSSYLTYAYFSAGTPGAWDLASKALSNVVLGTQTPEQAAGDIQRGIDQWFTPRS